ncbi:anthranilate phosphoribosyltransferase [Stella humosa]|uniref:Anthranilate phosphoribosyltransferase n=1 Tax=Stella humosa TaxID=94 RepID=A0A3N1MD45_9PROT|nr:anthranilate phosphoribosyltransferase [Stella humosa]ROQ01633.1 anthranilate phosphoribosyltransferase [Stella humosa]BBK32014.1 anthranilate phosphoribosyltransferase [Stella humosa]
MSAPQPPASDLKPYVAKAASGQPLTEAEAGAAFEIIMSGNATPSQMGGFLMALRVRGETVEEIVAAARVMRAKSLKVAAPANAVDTCGTGGDGIGTFNVSTGAALVVAACGVPVAKHGNRAISSRSGAADVLARLGVNLDCDMSLVEEAIREVGVGFLMAPRHHAATRHVAPTRVELGTRTIFNLLGPISSPAGVRRQLVGVYAREWVRPLAAVLQRLGSERAWVVHGSDGSDELTTAGPSHVAELRDGSITTFDVTPQEAGLFQANPADLRGGDPEANAQAMRAMLAGAPGAFRDIVLYNTAAMLVIAERATDLGDGVKIGSQAIDSGAALTVLDRLVATTNKGLAA